MNVQNINAPIVDSHVNQMKPPFKRKFVFGVERFHFFGLYELTSFQKIYDLCLPVIAFIGKLLECIAAVVKAIHKYFVWKMGSLVEQTIKIFNLTIKVYYFNFIVTDSTKVAEVLDICKARGINAQVVCELSAIKV